MSYKQILQRTWQDNFLFSVMLELTYRCNLDCYFCYNDVHAKGKPLSLDDYLVLFDDLQQLGTMNITLTGGEPLANPDFFAIGQNAREKGFVVRIKSNGHALSPKRARRIQHEINPFVTEISLHGASAQTHDRQTRVPGSFDQLMVNLQSMQDLGMRITLKSTLTAWNEAEIDAMFALADKLKLRLQFDPQVTPKDDGDQQPLSISASSKGLTHLLRIQAQRVAAAKAARQKPLPTIQNEDKPIITKHCGAGSSSLHIDPFGNVLPCVQWRRHIGNLHTTSIKEIWQKSEILKTVRTQTQKAKKIIDQQDATASAIGFCPGLAEELTGDPLKLYPSSQNRLAIQIKVEAETIKPEQNRIIVI